MRRQEDDARSAANSRLPVRKRMRALVCVAATLCGALMYGIDAGAQAQRDSDRQRSEDRLWETIRGLDDPLVFEDYLSRVESGELPGLYRAVARSFLERLRTGTRHGSLLEAVVANDYAAVAGLLNGGANPNAKDERGETPLHKAALANAIAMVTLLVSRGADPNASDALGETPLHTAVYAGAGQAVRALLGGGARIEDATHRGNTALHYAARFPDGADDPSTLVTLLEYGADFQARNSNGRTPLHRAVLDGGYRKVMALLDGGADPGDTDFNGGTPLHLAAYGGFPEIATALLARGARRDAVDSEGGTPLHTAARWNAREVARELLNRGADPFARDNLNRTPADLVGLEVNEGDEAMFAMLQEHAVVGRPRFGIEEFRHGNVNPELRVVSERDVAEEGYGYGTYVEVIRGERVFLRYDSGEIGSVLVRAGLVQGALGRQYLLTVWTTGAHSEVLLVHNLTRRGAPEELLDFRFVAEYRVEVDVDDIRVVASDGRDGVAQTFEF